MTKETQETKLCISPHSGDASATCTSCMHVLMCLCACVPQVLGTWEASPEEAGAVVPLAQQVGLPHANELVDTRLSLLKA